MSFNFSARGKCSFPSSAQIVEISSRWETLPNVKGWRLQSTTDYLLPCPIEAPTKEASIFGPRKRGLQQLINRASECSLGGAQGAPLPPQPSSSSPHHQHPQAPGPLTCLCPRSQAGTLTLTVRMVTLSVKKQRERMSEGENVSHLFHKHLLGFCCVLGAEPQG